MTHPSTGVPAWSSLVRVLLLVLLAVLFVSTVVAMVSTGTGALEKLVLAVVAVLLALAVPVVQRLGRGRP